MATRKTPNLGIPAELNSPLKLLDYVIDSGHDWLVDNNMTLDDFVFQFLNFVKASSSSSKQKINYVTSSNSSNIYDNISDLHSNTEPSVDEFMACGFDQVFVDAKWSIIEKSVRWIGWLDERGGYYFAFFIFNCTTKL